jgi:hypothetical protein
MRSWADDAHPWTVLDVSGGWSEMWHATLHRKPIIGGYLGRVPRRLEEWILRQPMLAAIVAPDGGVPLERVEAQIDHAPLEDLAGDRFSAEWTGRIVVPSAGVYAFRVTPAVDAVVDVDTASVVRHFSASPERPSDAEEGVGRKRLAAGSHTLDVRIFDVPAGTRMSLEWAPPDGAFAVVPAEAFRTRTGNPGIEVTYVQHVPVVSGLGRTAGRQALRALAIRYVVTADVDNRAVQDELALPLTYRGEDVRIYEVPPADD